MKRLFLAVLTILTLGTLGHTQSGTFVGGNPTALSATGAAPTISACGTSPTVVSGNNYAGSFTTGSGPITTCVLTFNPAFASAPKCVFTTVATRTTGIAITASTITFTGSADLTSVGIFYICVKV